MPLIGCRRYVANSPTLNINMYLISHGRVYADRYKQTELLLTDGPQYKAKAK